MKRCEEYVISLLEQCEDLREVETFLQTRQADGDDTVIQGYSDTGIQGYTDTGIQ